MPWTLRTPHAPPCCSPGLSHLRRLGLVYFLYLFLFSGLEFTLSFLAHQRFQFSRWACSPAKDPARGPPASRPGSCPATFPRAPPRTLGQDGCWWWSRAGCHLQGCGTDHPVRGRPRDSGSPFPHQPPVHQPDEEMRGGTPRGLWGSAQWREVVWFSEPRTLSLRVHGAVITSVGSISPLAPRVPPAGLPRGWGGWERRGGAGSQPLPRELSTSLLAEATNNSHHLGNSGAVRSSVPETRRVVNHRASVGLPRLTAP